MEATVITGEENTRNYRLLVIRRGLRMEIRTTLKASRGVSMLKLANDITGRKDRSKRAAYTSLDAHIVKIMGTSFGEPL